MNFKLLGSILLVAGNAIGAGMLALPIVSATLGFPGAAIFLLVGWVVMTAGALLLLEVNLWLPHNSNIISMARITIGPLGQMVAWCTYLLLLYSLLSAYIASGSDLLNSFLLKSSLHIPLWWSAIIFTVVFGAIVWIGIHAVDYANRGLMLAKLITYVLLIIFLIPFITWDRLNVSNLHVANVGTPLTVTLTAFGFAAIVPSLRIYFGSEVRQLKIAIIAGSLLPLICYLIWDAAIMGVIPLGGEQGLLSILHSPRATSSLTNTLALLTSLPVINLFAKIFTSICLLTSFLGVAISLADFLADGLQLEKKGLKHGIILFLTFFPPLILVCFFPAVFIKALEYAGIYCVILLVLLPALMAWRGRYIKKIAGTFRVPGGKVLLTVLIFFSLFVILQNCLGA